MSGGGIDDIDEIYECISVLFTSILEDINNSSRTISFNYIKYKFSEIRNIFSRLRKCVTQHKLNITYVIPKIKYKLSSIYNSYKKNEPREITLQELYDLSAQNSPLRAAANTSDSPSNQIEHHSSLRPLPPVPMQQTSEWSGLELTTLEIAEMNENFKNSSNPNPNNKELILEGILNFFAQLMA